jgi:hypothetical protein
MCLSAQTTNEKGEEQLILQEIHVGSGPLFEGATFAGFPVGHRRREPEPIQGPRVSPRHGGLVRLHGGNVPHVRPAEGTLRWTHQVRQTRVYPLPPQAQNKWLHSSPRRVSNRPEATTLSSAKRRRRGSQPWHGMAWHGMACRGPHRCLLLDRWLPRQPCDWAILVAVPSDMEPRFRVYRGFAGKFSAGLHQDCVGHVAGLSQL